MKWNWGFPRRRRWSSRSYPPRVVELLESRTLLSDGITPQPGPVIVGKPGVALTNVPVASFTVTNPTGAPGAKWRSLISWGDGQNSSLIPPTAGPNGTFQFLGTHTYASAGTYTIEVMIAVPMSQLPNDNTVTTKATIQAPVLNSIAVTPANPTLNVGATQQFTATGKFTDGSTQDVTGQVVWTSSNPAVGMVNSAGVVRTAAQGASFIIAALDGVAGFTQAIVNPPPPPFPVAGLQFQAKASKTFDRSVATFSEPNTTAKNFQVFIDWGDNSALSRGQVHAVGSGRFQALGLHRFTRPGVYHVTVTIRDPAGRFAEAATLISVTK